MAKLTLDTVPSGYLTATKYNSNNDLIEAALENTLSRDGTTPNNMEAELDMDSHKITNLGAPEAANDAARWVDVTDAVSLTGTAVPALTGNSQKYLGTDGSTLGWKNFYDQTTAESSAGVTPTNYIYPPRNVLRYGADPTGVANSSTAFANAELVRSQEQGKAAKITVPPGKYLVNMTITSDGCTLEGEGMAYNQTTATLFPYDETLPVIQIGDATHEPYDTQLVNLALRGGSSTTNGKGLLIQNAQGVYVSRCSVRGFAEYQVRCTSIAGFGTSYIFFEQLALAAKGVSGSRGFVINYGPAYTTAIFINNFQISGTSAGSFVIDMDASTTLRLSNGWITVAKATGGGINLSGTTSILYGSNVAVDSSNSTDVLLVLDNTVPIETRVIGNITFDGVCTMAAGNTAALTGKTFGTQHHNYSLFIDYNLYFQDTGASAEQRYGSYDSRIYRSSTNLFVHNGDGGLILDPLATGQFAVATVVKGQWDTNGLYWSGGYIRLATTTVAALPAAAAGNQGAMMMVSDSTVAAATNYGAIVAGGGANKVKVYSDGANWRIG